MQIKTKTSWAGSNPCLNTFYFCCFLKKGGLHAVSWCFFCNTRCCWCGRGLQVTTLTMGVENKGTGRWRPASGQGTLSIRSREGCGRVRWRVCGDVWAVATGWRVSGGDPQMFRFICFYSSLYSRVFPRS